MPYYVIDFFNWNANQLHDRIITLAEAIELGSVIGWSISMVFWVIAWVVLCLDFRAQVLQARRGYWQFNVKKTGIPTALTYMGTQTSNGLLVYLIITFFVTFWTIIFGWSVTQGGRTAGARTTRG